MISEHWTERVRGMPPNPGIGRYLIGIDESGTPVVPMLTGLRWKTRLDLRKPWHWPSYLLTRLVNAHTWVES